MCRMCGCYRRGIVVMDMIWHRLCVSMIICSELGKGTTCEAGKYFFRAANVWWNCAHCFVIASCG